MERVTCDFCFDGRHWKCRDINCGCDICALARRRVKLPPKREGKKRKPDTRVRDRTGESARYYQSPVPAEQQKMRSSIGVLTRFNPQQVARIFEAKEQGVTISELAREFDTTRDKIRTVYNCPAAPALGERGPVKGALRFTTIREEFDGERWTVAYKKQWSNSSR